MDHRKLPLSALRAFEATARHGRQTSAARELGVTHGAVSRQIQLLEAYLGLALFSGARNSPVLTDAGRMLLPELTAAFGIVHDAIKRIQIADSGILDVACLSTFAMRWLIPRLHRFQDLYPAIDVRLSTREYDVVRTRGRFDLSIIALEAVEKPNANDIVLFPEYLGVVVAQTLAKEQSIGGIEDIARIPRLAASTRRNAWSMWIEAAHMAEAELTPISQVEYEHYSFAIEAAANGLGACVAPYHLVMDDVKNGRLLAPFGFVETGYRYIVRFPGTKSVNATAFCTWLSHETAHCVPLA